MVLAVALAGCDDASKAIDQAQEAANKAIDTVQEQMESVEDAFNLDQFGDAAESAEQLAASVEEAMNVDFSDPQALIEAKSILPTHTLVWWKRLQSRRWIR